VRKGRVGEGSGEREMGGKGETGKSGWVRMVRVKRGRDGRGVNSQRSFFCNLSFIAGRKTANINVKNFQV
jgi:hypothetical protein